MSRSIRRLGYLFFLLFGLLSLDLGYWQIIAAPLIQQNIHNPRLYLTAEQVQRGAIYDRNGQLLARSVRTPNGAVRQYALVSLSPTLGYSSQRFSSAGLEASYNGYLTGQESTTTVTALLNKLLHRPQVGNDVYLTIDSRIQNIADAALGANQGAALVMNPRTGEVLALVSKPYFNNNLVDQPGYFAGIQQAAGSPLLNRVVSRFVPGSIFKTLTLAGVLDSNVVSLDTRFTGIEATGPVVVNGHPFTGNNLYGRTDDVSVTDAFRFSDNVVFAELGIKLGAARFKEYATRFGIGQDLNFDIPVATSTIVNPGDSLDDKVLLGSAAFGQGDDFITPLQMGMITSAIANGGKMMQPILVRSVKTPGGALVLQKDPSMIGTPVSPDTASKVNFAMVQVVAGQFSSGFNARIPGINVAGKTGTAQLAEGNPHAWFIAFAPAENPQLAVVVLAEHGGEGAFVAAPIARQILEQSLPLVQAR